MLGVRQGKWTQNLLTTAKALGLLLLAAAALLAQPGAAPAEKAGPLPFSLALIFVLFTYGGWNEMAYVAAEVRDPRRNIVRALVAGLGAVTAALSAGEWRVPARARLRGTGGVEGGGRRHDGGGVAAGLAECSSAR